LKIIIPSYYPRWLCRDCPDGFTSFVQRKIGDWFSQWK